MMEETDEKETVRTHEDAVHGHGRHVLGVLGRRRPLSGQTSLFILINWYRTTSTQNQYSRCSVLLLL